MVPKKSFAEFVAEKSANSARPTFDPEREIKEWLEHLENLYTKLEGFLSEFIENGQAEFKRKPFPFQEDSLGTYIANNAVLRFGQLCYLFQPKGTMLIGSKGRVDVIGPGGTRFMALVEANSPRRRPDSEARCDWRWAIISERPPYNYADLTKDNFEKLLMKLG